MPDVPDVTSVSSVVTWVIAGQGAIILTLVVALKYLHGRLLDELKGDQEEGRKLVQETSNMMGVVSERIAVNNQLCIEVKDVLKECKAWRDGNA